MFIYYVEKNVEKNLRVFMQMHQEVNFACIIRAWQLHSAHVCHAMATPWHKGLRKSTNQIELVELPNYINVCRGFESEEQRILREIFFYKIALRNRSRRRKG